MRCENARKTGGAIVPPSCGGEDATTMLTIVYSKLPSGGEDADTLSLCARCAKIVREDAEGHGYTVRETEE